MNWLDIVLGVTISGSTIAGAIKGFARTAIGITATILAFVLALWFYGVAGEIFREYVSSKAVSNFLGFTVVFLVVVLAGSLTGRLIALMFKWAGLSWLDRTLGACFGLLRGLLVSTIFVMILVAFSVSPPPKSVAQSNIAPYVLEAAHLFSRLAPHELTQGFATSYEKLKKVWSETFGKDTPKATEH
jgi:membrane protein required for colicin V production